MREPQNNKETMGWRKRALCVATNTEGLKLLCAYNQPSLPYHLLKDWEASEETQHLQP